MATPKSQRIGILIIAAVMVLSTIGMFAGMVLGQMNASTEQDRVKIVQQKYQEEYSEYMKKVEAQGKELSKTYYPTFSKYKDTPSKYDKDSVKELKTRDLKVGDGEEIKDGTKYLAYYIGWNSDGVVFDQSIQGEELRAPIDPSSGLIAGWTEGVKGMKIGGVREISIPSDKAYGEKGSGDKIPPNMPIKFVVMAIPKTDEIKQPEIPQELLMQGGYY